MLEKAKTDTCFERKRKIDTSCFEKLAYICISTFSYNQTPGILSVPKVS